MAGRIVSSKVSPDFLHANSTNHNWAFSAFAELIDNSCDAKARDVRIDVVNLGEYTCLSFQDDGNGMNRDQLYDMLSFGFCGRHLGSAIGKYGNGFKSGSMRLGRDAIVFTRTEQTAGVGLLSQTYNKDTDAETVLNCHVATQDENLNEQMRIFTQPETQAHSDNLTAVLQHSMFENEDKLKTQIQLLPKTGTRIIIYSLHRTRDNRYLELDFDTDPEDIRCPENYDVGSQYSSTSNVGSQHSPTYKVSLKEYCSILYLQPRIKIRLRGAFVKTRLIAKSLCNTQVDEYIPKGVTTSSQHSNHYAHTVQRNTITFGFLPGSFSSEDYGMMLYSDNRLIKPYEQVSCQRRGDGVGAGVFGVTQAKFLTPTNTKQNFVRDEKYRSAMTAYNTKLKNYWDSTRAQPSTSTSRRIPDSVWAQCDNKSCLKWRRLPPGTQPADLPARWYCYLHPDHITCNLPEDMHEDEDITVAPARLRSAGKRSTVPKLPQVINEKRSRRMKSSVPEDRSRDSSEHSTRSPSTVGKASASTNQNAHSKYYSSHLQARKIAVRGTNKKTSQGKNSKVSCGSSFQKTSQVNSQKKSQVNSQKPVGGSSCQTRKVTSTKSKSKAQKSEQVAMVTSGPDESSHQDGGASTSAENRQGPGDDNVYTISEDGSKIVDDVGLSASDDHDDNVSDVIGDTEHGDSVTELTVDTEHNNNDVINLPVDTEPKRDDSSSPHDADEAASIEARGELSLLRSELNQLRERFQSLLINSRRLLQMLAPNIPLDEDVDIEQLIANLLEHGHH